MAKHLILVGFDHQECSRTISLKNDAENILDKANIKHHSIHVPGVFEIPVIISKNIKKYDGFIALGCVIKGETPHFDYISSSISNSLMDLSLKYSLPVANGVLNCLNIKQSKIRSSSKKNKGIEAANALLSVLKNL